MWAARAVLGACGPTQCLHRAARGCLWVGGAGLSSRGERTWSLMLQVGTPKSLELSAQLCCAHLAWLPGALHAALSLPLLNRMGEKAQLTNSWVEAKNTLLFPCIKPTDNKLCVLMAAHQMQVFLHTWEQL